jgi:hypothetical protein
MLLLRGFPGARLFSDRGVIARVDGRVMSFLRSAWVVTGYWRNPSADLMMPNTGSGVCLRWA